MYAELTRSTSALWFQTITADSDEFSRCEIRELKKKKKPSNCEYGFPMNMYGSRRVCFFLVV